MLKIKKCKWQIIGLSIVIFLFTISYFLITLKGFNFYGIYDKHLAAYDEFKSDCERYAVDLEFLYQEIKNNYVNLKYKEELFNFSWQQLYEEAVKELQYIKTEADFYELACQMLYKLRDGHSSFNVLADYPYDFNYSITSLFKVRYIENRPIIVAATPHYTLSSNSVLGKEIISIDGINFNKIVDNINEKYGRFENKTLGRSDIAVLGTFWRYFYEDNYKLPKTLNIELREFNGSKSIWQLDTTKQYNKVPLNNIQGVNFGVFKSQLPSYRKINQDIAYIKIPTFISERRFIRRRFEDIVKELKKDKIKAVVIDIRHNRGGNSSFRDVLSFLVTETIDIAYYRLRKSERFLDMYYFREIYENMRSRTVNVFAEKGYSKWWAWSVKPNDEQFLTSIPVALLVNERIFSSASFFAKACLDYDLTTVIGNTIPLSGYGLPTSIALPSGKYAVTYGFFETRDINYKQLENTYSTIDLYVNLKLSDVLQEKDSQLEAAICFLNEKIK